MFPTSSVRVEVEGNEPAEPGLDIPIAPKEPSSGRSIGIAVVLVVLAGLLVALVALQPSDEENADGIQRQATTTVPATTNQSVSRSTAGDDPLESFVADVQEFVADAEAAQVDFGPRFGRIVASEDGFLGLNSTGAIAGIPGLFESSDGQTWTRAEVFVPDFDIFDHEDVWVNFSDLVATDEGFALLRSETAFSQTFPDFERVALVHRLISPDGRNWSIDPEFEASSNFAAVNPLLHLPEAIVTLAEDSQVDARPNNPEQFSAVSECVTVLAERSGEVTLNIARRDELGDLVVPAKDSILHTAIRGGSFASLHLGDLVAPRGTACSEALGLSASQEAPSVEIIDIESGAQRSIPLPDALSEVPFDEWDEPQLVSDGDSLLAILANAVWQLDLRADGTWTELGPLPVTLASPIEQFRLLPDARVIGLARDTIVVSDYTTGQTTFDPAFLFDQPRIVYVDDQVVLLSTSDRPTTSVIRVG